MQRPLDGTSIAAQQNREAVRLNQTSEAKAVRLHIARSIAGVLVAGSWGAVPVSAQGLPNPGYGPSDTPGRSEAAFAFITDSVAQVVGLPVLRDVSIPEGATELRLWVGFGVAMPHHLLRIIQAGAGVSAQAFIWWESSAGFAADSAAGMGDYIRSFKGANPCFEAQTGGRWTRHDAGGGVTVGRQWQVACPMEFRGREPEWSEVLDSLNGARVLDLPSPAELSPREVDVTDGTSLQVESLEGDRYRTYMYSNPQYQPWPEADKAQRIIEIVYWAFSRRPRGRSDFHAQIQPNRRLLLTRFERL